MCGHCDINAVYLLDAVENATSPSFISLHNFFIISQLIIPIINITLHIAKNFKSIQVANENNF